jgi:hypothetical protein
VCTTRASVERRAVVSVSESMPDTVPGTEDCGWERIAPACMIRQCSVSIEVRWFVLVSSFFHLIRSFPATLVAIDPLSLACERSYVMDFGRRYGLIATISLPSPSVVYGRRASTGPPFRD